MLRVEHCLAAAGWNCRGSGGALALIGLCLLFVRSKPYYDSGGDVHCGSNAARCGPKDAEWKGANK